MPEVFYIRKIAGYKRFKNRVKFSQDVKVGDIYNDCSHHPVLCTESSRGDVAGISLFDGSHPRSCSIKHCGVWKMSPAAVHIYISHRDEILAAEEEFRANYRAGAEHDRPNPYATVQKKIEALLDNPPKL